MRVFLSVALVSTLLLPSVSRSATIAADSPEIGYIRLLPNDGVPTPAGLAIFGYRAGGVLVNEAGVPSAALIPAGRIFVDVNGPVTTGIAIANPLDQDAVISYYFTDSAGNDSNRRSLTLLAKNQMAALMTDPPFNGPSKMLGTFTFSSTSPVAATALRGLTNQRGEFLVTTLPVSPVGDTFGGNGVVFPHFADGGGWTTQIVLINPGNLVLTGSVQFMGQGSKFGAPKPVKVSINGTTSSAFSYTIPPRSAVRMSCDRIRDNTAVGSVRVIPTRGNAPSGLVIFAVQNSGVTVSTTSVPAMPQGTAFRIYAESIGTIGSVGSIQSALAISNPSSTPVMARLNIFNMDGSPTGISRWIYIPAGGQIAKYVDELVNLPNNFKGVVKLSTATPVVVTSLRTRYNERRDLLVTTTPPWDEADPPITGEMDFPHVINGGGYTTQLVLIAPGSYSSSGKLSLMSQSGAPLTSLKLQPLP
jgi:hypothetical protein